MLGHAQGLAAQPARERALRRRLCLQLAGQVGQLERCVELRHARIDRGPQRRGDGLLGDQPCRQLQTLFGLVGLEPPATLRLGQLLGHLHQLGVGFFDQIGGRGRGVQRCIETRRVGDARLTQSRQAALEDLALQSQNLQLPPFARIRLCLEQPLDVRRTRPAQKQ